MLSQRGRLPASSLCSLGSLVFTADLLLWIRHALWARSSLWCTLGSAGSSFRYTFMPPLLYLFFSYISPIYPSPLVHWLCHTFVVYQLDSYSIRAKASPLPLSLVPFPWALSPPLGILFHWLGYGLQPRGLQPSNPRLPLAASSSLFHLLWSSRFFIHLFMPWAQIPPHDHYSLPTHGQPFDRSYIKPASLFVS